MEDQSNKDFIENTPNKHLVTATKIIAVYSVFYIVLKVIAVLLGKSLYANLILGIPFVFIGILSLYTIFFKKYSWILTIFIALIILVIRVFEVDWTVDISNYFNQ